MSALSGRPSFGLQRPGGHPRHVLGVWGARRAARRCMRREAASGGGGSGGGSTRGGGGSGGEGGNDKPPQQQPAVPAWQQVRAWRHSQTALLECTAQVMLCSFARLGAESSPGAATNSATACPCLQELGGNVGRQFRAAIKMVGWVCAVGFSLFVMGDHIQQPTRVATIDSSVATLAKASTETSSKLASTDSELQLIRLITTIMNR